MADPMQGMGAEDPSEEQPAGFSVTVTDQGDGTYSIAQNDADAGEGEPAQPPQTANSIEEACQMMEQMFQGESGEEAQEGEDPNASLGSKDNAQKVWNQMASKKDKGAM